MSDESVKNTRSIRTFNTSLILQAMHRRGACSRTELSQASGLSPSTVTRIVGELVEMGVVYEDRHGESTGGRRPIILRLNYSKLFVIGVQVHRSRVAIALADLRGTLLYQREYGPWALDPALLIKELAHQLDDFIQATGVNREEHLLGVGLAISGVVDSELGTVVQSINLGWRDVPVVTQLGELLKLPVFLENDANAGALAETWLGKARGVGNFLYLKTEAGVGAAVVIDERLVAGERGMAGEIGHVPLMRNGYRCRCGQRGCLETYVYLPDVFARYEERTGQAIDKATFFSSEKKNDPVVRQLIGEAEEALILALSFPVALLDLDSVIVGGIWGQDEASVRRIQRRCQNHAERTGLTKEVTVTGSGLEVESDLYGAIGLVIDRYLSPARAPSGSGALWEWSS